MFRVGDRVRFKYNYYDRVEAMCTVRAPTEAKPANATVLCALALPDVAARDAYIAAMCGLTLWDEYVCSHVAEEYVKQWQYMRDASISRFYCVHADYCYECGGSMTRKTGLFCLPHWEVPICGDTALMHDMPAWIGWTCTFTAIGI